MLFPSQETYLEVAQLVDPLHTRFSFVTLDLSTFDLLVIWRLRDYMCGKKFPDARRLTEGARNIDCDEM